MTGFSVTKHLTRPTKFREVVEAIRQGDLNNSERAYLMGALAIHCVYSLLLTIILYCGTWSIVGLWHDNDAVTERACYQAGGYMEKVPDRDYLTCSGTR